MRVFKVLTHPGNLALRLCTYAHSLSRLRVPGTPVGRRWADNFKGLISNAYSVRCPRTIRDPRAAGSMGVNETVVLTHRIIHIPIGQKSDLCKKNELGCNLAPAVMIQKTTACNHTLRAIALLRT